MLPSPVANFSREFLKKANETLGQSWTPIGLAVSTSAATAALLVTYRFLFDNDENLSTRIKQTVFRLARYLPVVQDQIAKARDETLGSIYHEISTSVDGHQFLRTLPEQGMSKQELISRLNRYRDFEKIDYTDGRVSGCVYKVTQDEMTELYNHAFALFGDTNPLHADVFPDIRTMEAEVVRCVASLFNGDSEVCGTMTSGGTESLLMACKAYRDLAYSKGIKRPEIVMPVTAHPAFNKAAAYFRMKIIRIPVDPKTLQVDLKQMRKAITKNTCMLVGSAPNFPHGIIDPISEISKIAIEKKIPLHVDACLGGFLIVFMERAGYDLPKFDFRVPGVTSISCDTHKYGYTPKGTSVILYRNEEFRSHQFYALADWPGGIYASPSIAGSRSGYLISCCWLTLMHYGFEGYVEETRKIIEATRTLAKGWSEMEGLYVFHQPDVSIVAIGSNEFNIYYLLDGLKARGWHLNGLQEPAGLQIALTQLQTKPEVIETLLRDTKECIENIRNSENKNDTPTAVIYGTNQKVPDKSLVCDFAKLYIAACYETNFSSPTEEEQKERISE